MTYFGSKSRHAKQIAKAICNDLSTNHPDTFISPFCGYLSVESELIQRLHFTHIILSDINPAVIALWKAMINNTILLSSHQPSREEYYLLKKTKGQLPLKGVVGFNCSRFGLYFSTYFSIPHSHWRSRMSTLNHRGEILREYKDSITLYNGGYDKYQPPKHSLLFLDPPYQSYEGVYHNKKFNTTRFYRWLHRLLSPIHGNIVYLCEENIDRLMKMKGMRCKVVWERKNGKESCWRVWRDQEARKRLP